MIHGEQNRSAWTSPPEQIHRPDCPMHEDNLGEETDVICLCEELADAEYEAMVEAKNDAEWGR